jgi:hypothetical protein
MTTIVTSFVLYVAVMKLILIIKKKNRNYEKHTRITNR